MSRIPEGELEQLKREVSLPRLVAAKGIELKKHGADLIGLCPFHNDTTPSLVVSPRRNLWHCLGACQAGGSVLDWVMKAEGVSFRHAVELLRREAPALGARLQKSQGRAVGVAKRSTVTKLEVLVERDAGDAAALRRVVDYYHATLQQSTAALAYLAQRGLENAAMVEHFRLGYANRTLGYHLPEKNRQAGAELRGRLQKLGLLRASGHEHFSGSLVIPIFGEGGEVEGMYGRKIRDDLRAGTAYHLYLPGGHRGVWNREGLRGNAAVIVCEALLDALTFWCAGYRNVTSAYGVEGFTAAHLEALKSYGTERVLIAYDRDEAGERGAAKLATRLLAEGMECFRVEFPRGMDANEYARAVRPAAKSLGLALRQASWLGKGRGPARPRAPIPRAAPEDPVSLEDPASLSPPAAARVESPAGASLAPVAAAAVLAAAPVSPPVPRVPAALAPATSSAAAGASAGGAAAAALLELEGGEGDEWVAVFGPRRWRIRGMAKNSSYEVLRLNLLCTQGEGFHVDTLDLYSARQRAGFVRQASLELGVDEEALKRELGKILLRLEALQDEQLQATLAPKAAVPEMSEQERAAALELLRDPHLCARLLADFERLGVVGEETNKLVGYIGAVSRKLEAPLAIIVQSSSAAGKSSLLEAVLALVPQEERVKFSAMTGQSLFYMGETDLEHKLLAIVEEEGAQRAAYALKLLQSEGELTIASTGKDPATGRLVTHEYRVQGPVMIFLTTTAIDIDEELLNRCIVLTVNEEREQTRAIHRMQRRSHTLAGVLAREERGAILRLHQNAQRLLQPLLVVNPFAESLTFLDEKTRTRRDHMKYLTLIRAIALLHQYQRPLKRAARPGGGGEVEYIEAERGDVVLANRLAHEVLGRSLDELSPQTRRFLEALEAMVGAGCEKAGVERRDYRFGRREVLDATGLGLTQVRSHLERLVALEYVLVHRGGRGQSFAYELLYDGGGKDGRRFVMNLLEPEELPAAVASGESSATTERWRGSEGGLAGSWRGQNGAMAGGWRSGENAAVAGEDEGKREVSRVGAENAVPGERTAERSQSQVVAVRR